MGDIFPAGEPLADRQPQPGEVRVDGGRLPHDPEEVAPAGVVTVGDAGHPHHVGDAGGAVAVVGEDGGGHLDEPLAGAGPAPGLGRGDGRQRDQM